MSRNPHKAGLDALFLRHGFVPSDVPILQPAEPFIELSGEDIRRRLFLVSEAGGAELCLRPEFTIPAARAHIGSKQNGPGNFAFVGPVFRQRAEGSGEFLQASLESFGRGDIEAADADMLALAIETEAALGDTRHAIRIGDVGLTAALIAALAISPTIARKLRQNGLTAPAQTAAKSSGNGLASYQGVLAALKGTDPTEARAFVQDLLSIAGLKSVGGRTPAEIADRFLEKATDSSTGVSTEQAAVLTRFRTIQGDPKAVAGEVRGLARDAGLDLNQALDRFETRTGLIAAKGIDINRLDAATGFARNLDYYTGFVFEFVAGGSDRPVIAGGRYDGLLRRLGAKSDIPAVGCAIWLDRFAAMGEPT